MNGAQDVDRDTQLSRIADVSADRLLAQDDVVVGIGATVIPDALLEQLALGGRLVLPVMTTWGAQQLLLITRTGELTLWREVIDQTAPASAAARRQERIS